MVALSIVLVCIGGVCLIVGIGFIFPARVVGRLSATTNGIIRDITYDALKYNEQSALNVGNNYKNTNAYIQAGVGSASHVGNNSQCMYHAIYFYRVNGVEYSRADGPGYNKGLAEKKIGKEVTVYYDPANPLKSSLSSGKIYKILSVLLLSIGALSGIVGLIIMLII